MSLTRNDDKPIFNVYSPDVRDSSYLNGLNEVIQKVESSCGLAAGTLSHAENVEKTATELRISRQRSYTFISSLQKALQEALEQLAEAAYHVMEYYDVPCSSAEISCNWGDSVLEDYGETFNRLLPLAQSGFLKPEFIIMKEFGCTEEEARKMMPNNSLESSGGGLFGDV